MKVIKKLLIDVAKKNDKTRKLLRRAQRVSKRMHCLYYMHTINVDEKVVVFSSFMGRKYACSPRAIFETMKSMPEFQDYEFIWAFKNKTKEIQGAQTVRYGSRNHYKACARAKYIFDNSRLPDYITFNNKQIFTQCWHGTPLKRLGYDIDIEGGNALNSKSDLRTKYKTDAQKYTNLISPSKYTTEKYISAFNLKDNNPKINIIEQGYPRNDMLNNFDDEDVNRLKATLNVPMDKKVILYAPTWRDNQHLSGVGYTYELGVDFTQLQKELGDDYIILFRPHYFIANEFDFGKYKDFVYDVSQYDEISELYIISDILITDYSSVFFDYAILRRKIIFYMYDLEEYQTGIRDFYIGLEDLPGEIITIESRLIEHIKEEFQYDSRYEEFNEIYNYLEDGNAAKRVIDIVFAEDK